MSGHIAVHAACCGLRLKAFDKSLAIQWSERKWTVLCRSSVNFCSYWANIYSMSPRSHLVVWIWDLYVCSKVFFRFIQVPC